MHNQRVFFSNNGTLSDLSINLNEFRSGTEVIDIVALEDYVFIASFLPFNHKQIDIESANAQSSSITVEYWDGSNWRAAVDVIDRTDSSGASLAQDGIISWSTDLDYTWQREHESADVTGLTGTNIYDMYWLRLSWSADLTNTTELKFIGQKFSSDNDLYSYYPDLNDSNLKTAYQSGKTDWNDQHYIAAENISRDLKNNHDIITSDQIMDFDLFEQASCHQVAQIVYRGLRQFEIANDAKNQYQESMNLALKNIDVSGDGRLDTFERPRTSGYLKR